MAAFTRFQALLALCLLSLGSLAAHAATDFHVYSDHPFIEGNCGATFANLGETLTGFDRRIRVRVGDTLPPVIEVVEVQTCGQGGFGAAQLVDAGIPVGLENGTGGGDVVEFQVPLASINGPIGAPVRLTFAAIDEVSGSEDLLATIDGSPGAAPILLGLPTEVVPIPLLSPWVLFVLAGLMALAAVLVLRRHPGLGVALLMVAGVGVAWAAHMVADGQVGDWTGIAPLATDPQGDSVPYRSNTDMLAAFGTVDEDRVFFRIDVVSLTNTPPVANPQAVTLLEDSSVLITLSGSDADGDPITLAIATQPTRGTLQNFQPDTPAPGQAQVTYVGNTDEFGADSFTFVANDGQVDSTPATVSIDITPVNDAPSFTAVDPPSVLEDAGAQSVVGWATFSAGPPNESGQGVLGYFVSNVSNPGLFAAPPIVVNDGTLSYTPADDANGTSTFDVFVQDDGGTANGGVDVSPTQTFTITVTAVNDAPTFTGGPDQSVLEDSGPHLVAGWASGMSAGPPDEAGQALSFVVTDNSNPALFSAGPAVDATSGDLSYALVADAFGVAVITLVLTDDGGTANGGEDTSAPHLLTVTVTGVNDPPSFVVGPDVLVDEDAGPQLINPWATAVSAGPPNESGQALTFSVTGNTNPALFAAGPAVSPTGALSFTTAANANGGATITIQLMDDGGTDNGGVDTSPTQDFTITVAAVNDAPVNSVPGPQSVDEDNTLLFAGAAAISVSDVDIGAGLLTVTLEVNDGVLDVTAAGAVTILGSGSALLQIEGTLADVNATLLSLGYSPDPDFNGSDTLSMLSNDNGNTGIGGPLTDLSTVAITVNPINDAPVNTVPGEQIVSGGIVEFSTVNGNAISVFDVDAEDADIQVDLSVTEGVLMALPTAGVTISNNGSDAITLLGPQDDINLALDGLIYTATGVGVDTLVMLSDDLGNSGAGGALTDTSMVTLLIDEPPSVIASAPSPGDTTANNVALSITFSEAIDAAVNYATLSCGGGPDLITAGQSGSNVTVLTPTYTGPLPNGASCTLTILAAAITDVDVIDPPDNMAANYVVSFTVDAAPEVDSTVPDNGATDVALASTITVNFSEAVDVAAGGITLDCDGPISFDAGPLPAVNVTSVALTPSSPLPATTVCNGSVIAASVTDVDAFDPPDAMEADFNWSFTTLDLPPEVVSTTPANGAVDVNPTGTITIDFSESVNFDTTANAGNTSFNLGCPAATDFTVVTASPATSVVLDPVDSAVAAADCTLTVLAAGITDADLIDPPDNMLADFSASFSYGALALDDAYVVTPHLTLGVGTATPQGGGVLVNDVIGTGTITGFGFAPACTGTAPGNQLDAGAANGRLTLGADGSFSYEPPAGVANANRTFCYTVTGGSTANIVYNIQNTELVWFVDAAAGGGGIGTQARPFQALAAAAGADTPNDTIHLAFNASPYTGGITLEAGGRLIGAGSGSDLATITGIMPVAGSVFPALGGSTPTITCANATCITLATNNTLRGFTIGDSGPIGTDLLGDNFGTLTVAELSLNGSGRALSLSNGTLNGSFLDIDVTSANQNAFTVFRVGGTWSVADTVEISGVSGEGIGIIEAPAGTSISFDGGVAVTIASIFDAVGLLENDVGASISLGNLALSNSGSGGGLFVVDSPVSISGGASTITSGGQALELENAVLVGGATFASVSSTGSSTEGIRINGLTGALTINGGAISGSAGTAFLVNGGLGGGVSYAGAISKTSVGRLVDINGAGGGNLTLSGNLSCTGSCGTGAGNQGLRVNARSGGTLSFSGASKVFSSSATNPGVSLTSNTGATLSFPNGGLAITTTGGAGFNATGGGTVTVQGAANTIVSTTGTALNVVDTNIGASGLNFRSIGSNGGTNGIVLNNTGVAGGLTVTGVGTTAGSGGTIQNKTDDGVRLESTRNVTLNFMNLTNTASVGAPSATCGTNLQGNTGCSAAIDMLAVTDITLNGLNISGGQQYGINGNGVASFSLIGSTISNSGDQLEEDGIRFINLTGTSLIRNTTVQNSFTNNLRIYNTVAAPLTLTIDETVAGTSRFLNALFNDGILFQGLNNANMTLSVSGTDFDSSDGDHIQTAIDDTATMGIIIMNNVMSANADPTVLGSGITLSSSADFNGLKAFNISNNTINGANAKAININLGTSTAGGGTGTYEGVIINNVIGTNGVPESGGAGIDVVANGGGTLTAQVTGNTVQQFDSDHGIRVLHRDGNGRINATVTSNVVRLPEPGGFNGVSVQGGATSGPPIDSGTICLDFSGNTMAGSGAGGGSATDFRLRQRFNTIFQLRGYAGLAGDTAAVVAYVQGINPGAESGSATVETIPPTGSGFINTPGGAACPLP